MLSCSFRVLTKTSKFIYGGDSIFTTILAVVLRFLLNVRPAHIFAHLFFIFAFDEIWMSSGGGSGCSLTFIKFIHRKNRTRSKHEMVELPKLWNNNDRFIFFNEFSQMFKHYVSGDAYFYRFKCCIWRAPIEKLATVNETRDICNCCQINYFQSFKSTLTISFNAIKLDWVVHLSLFLCYKIRYGTHCANAVDNWIIEVPKIVRNSWAKINCHLITWKKNERHRHCWVIFDHAVMFFDRAEANKKCKPEMIGLFYKPSMKWAFLLLFCNNLRTFISSSCIKSTQNNSKRSKHLIMCSLSSLV